MSVFEVHCGPVDRRYLMKKTKDELATLVLDLLRRQDVEPPEVGLFYVAYQATVAGTIFRSSRLMHEKRDALVCAQEWEAGRHKSNDHVVGVLTLTAKEKNHDAN